MLRRRGISFLLASVFLFGSSVVYASGVTLTETPNTNDDYYLSINGESQAERPLEYSGRTLVPIRVISEKMGASVDYNDKTQDITIKKGNIVINLKVGSKDAKVNGQGKVLDVPASVKDGKTYVPVRFVSEALGIKVNYNSARKEVVVGEQKVIKGYKVPTIHMAKPQSVKVRGTGGWVSVPGNSIEGEIVAKYGDVSTKMHTYGSINQAQYDKVVGMVESTIKSIKPEEVALSYTWVYLQDYFKNPKLDGEYYNPVLDNTEDKGMQFKDFKRGYEELLYGIDKGWISPEEAEQVVMYNIIRGNVKRKLDVYSGADSANGKNVWSAYHQIVEKIKDCDTTAQVDLLIADVLGMNGAIFGSPGHAWFALGVGGYWYDYGMTPKMGIKSNVYKRVEVLESPTYDMSAYYRP